MSQMSDYLENSLINHVFRNIPMSAPPSVFVGLFTSNPGDGNTGTEVNGFGYARQQLTMGMPSNGSSNNTAQLNFPVATGGSWGIITHAAVFDAASGGNMLVYGPLSASKQIDDGDQFIFKTNQFVVNFM